MITDEMLMKTFIRTSAHARRYPIHKDEASSLPSPDERTKEHKHPPMGRGFGHILELLVPGEGVSQQWIADQIQIRAQSVSEAIMAMEKRGFIRREASQTDRRVMLIFITELGVEHRRKAAAERTRHAKEFFSVLTDEEKEVLYDILKKLNQKLQSETAFSAEKKEEM